MRLAPPTLLQIFCLPTVSPPYAFHVHVRRYAIQDVEPSAMPNTDIAVANGRGHAKGVDYESLARKGGDA
jgi:hypothetical protein